MGEAVFLWFRMNYLTGRGFLGTVLAEQFKDVVHIPHEKISTVKLKPFDTFFFLSTYGNLASHTDENAIFKANIEDLLAVLKQVKGVKGKQFVYVSSSSVARKVQTTYSRCKKAAEEILLAFMEKTEIPVIIIRPFSITGVGDQREHFLPTLIRSAYSGQTVDLVPGAYHDWIDVEDVRDAILNLSQNHARGVFQVGTGIQHSNLEVLKTVERLTGKRIPHVITQSMRPYDSEEWVSTNFKARSWGWLPKKTLEQIVSEMSKDYQRELNAREV
jgi:nucleoside-diphosphate-sugar epimerase